LLTLEANDPIKRAVSKGREFEPPNQQTKYTNVNYKVLEEIVRYVSGNDLSLPITEGIFKPLGVKDSRYPTTSETPGELCGNGWNDRTQTLI
jgi:CubicO group peptidase (beta-lactamase class C family)